LHGHVLAKNRASIPAKPDKSTGTRLLEQRPHFRNGRFHNRYSSERHGALQALKWLPEFIFLRLPKVHFPVLRPDVVMLKANRSESTLTWIGHSTFLIQTGGLNIITDPVFSDRASPFAAVGPRRMVPPAMAYADLPPLDIAVVSHNHYDHLDEAAVRRLAKDHPHMKFVVALGLAQWFRRRGMRNVVELDWWQEAQAINAKITAVPVQHFSGRGAHDRNATLWCGFVIEIAGRKIFFAGDTGYSRDFADIGERFASIDLALIPIGAYEPRWFMRPVHVDPAEAVRIHLDLRSRQSVAMHWGTFQLTAEPADQPPKRLMSELVAANIPEEKFWVFKHGETRSF
jgi:N-acyl-phosphatidylethanolamine-hydrolysing phospholipase D